MWTITGGIIVAVVGLAALPLIFWAIVLLVVPISDTPTHHQHPNDASQATQKAARSASPASRASGSSNH
jgi:hypothetical protein